MSSLHRKSRVYQSHFSFSTPILFGHFKTPDAAFPCFCSLPREGSCCAPRVPDFSPASDLRRLTLRQPQLIRVPSRPQLFTPSVLGRSARSFFWTSLTFLPCMTGSRSLTRHSCNVGTVGLSQDLPLCSRLASAPLFLPSSVII